MNDSIEDAALALAARLPNGRAFATQASDLAAELGCSERTVRALVEELIDNDWLIGSVCSGERPGYFRCVDAEDVRIGTAHLISRARSMLRRVRKLEANAAAQFDGDQDVLRLFNLEEVRA